MRVLVLDGDQKSALSVVRSLGSRGISVAVGSAGKFSLASCSRYCDLHWEYPHPDKVPDLFLNEVSAFCRREKVGILLPMTDLTMDLLLQKRNSLPETILPFPPYDDYSRISDKANLFRTAGELALPVPLTHFSDDYPEGRQIFRALRMDYPLVLKPFRSQIRANGRSIKTRVLYANDEVHLHALTETEPFRSHPFLIQEKIEGPGIGIFFLAHEGRVLAHFAHRRLREKPPSGGVSVLCESIEAPPVALESGRKIMEAFSWSGVAMVEFKQDRRDGIPKLMEVNGRFWGSLELAVRSGIDFPYLLYRYGQGERDFAQLQYRKGVRLRWELGDLDHLFLRLRCRAPFGAGQPARRIQAVGTFLGDALNPKIQNEIFRLSDPRPFAHEAIRYLKNLISH